MAGNNLIIHGHIPCFKPGLAANKVSTVEKLNGRQVEKKLLQDAIVCGAPELIALLDPRRVGKTFLIRQYHESRF